MKQVVYGILIAIHGIVFWLMIISCALSIALIALQPDSRWEWHEVALCASWLITLILCFATIGSEHCMRSYRKDMDEKELEMM